TRPHTPTGSLVDGRTPPNQYTRRDETLGIAADPPRVEVGADGSGDHQGTTARNWNTGVVPSSSDYVVFSGLASNDNCTLASSPTIATLASSSGYSGTLTLMSGATLLVSHGRYTGQSCTWSSGSIAGAGTLVIDYN